MDCSLPGFFVHGILQARILKWAATPFSKGSSGPRDRTESVMSLALVGRFFTTSTTWEGPGGLGLGLGLRLGIGLGLGKAQVVQFSSVAQSCPTLCDPIDGSPPGSAVPGILQARILEWVTISFSRGSSQPRDRIWVSRIAADSLPSEPLGNCLMRETDKWIRNCIRE